MRKAIIDGRTGITCGKRSDGSVAVLFDDADEIVWLPAEVAQWPTIQG